jgi:hypothetical protein
MAAAAGVAAITVTGALGPGLTTTALVYNNVTNFEVDFVEGVYSITYSDSTGPHTVKYAYVGVATITWTPTTKTVVIST